MKGVVIKSTGNLCHVMSSNKKYSCKIKGKNRLKKIEFTNPISVGDYVDFCFDKTNNIGIIEKVYERKNYIIRKSVNLSHKSQIIASNIDLALLIVTMIKPVTSLNFIDRFLIQAEAYGIESKIIFNKIDLHDKVLKKQTEECQKIYQSIGYETIPFSIKDPKNLSIIKQLLCSKITVLSGHSGVGKSSIINLIEPSLNLKTKDISNYHNQGVHTTTYAEMYPLSCGGYVVDTPGIKGLGIINLDMNTLSNYFREMFTESKNCKFKNCIHVNEPECGVLDAIKNKRIAQSRYKNYLSMLEQNTNYRKPDFS